MYNTIIKALIIVTGLASFTERVADGCFHPWMLVDPADTKFRLRGPISIQVGDKFEIEIENGEMKKGNHFRVILTCQCNFFVLIMVFVSAGEIIHTSIIT